MVRHHLAARHRLVATGFAVPTRLGHQARFKKQFVALQGQFLVPEAVDEPEAKRDALPALLAGVPANLIGPISQSRKNSPWERTPF